MEKLKEVWTKVELFLIVKVGMKPAMAKLAMVAVPAVALFGMYHTVSKWLGF